MILALAEIATPINLFLKKGQPGQEWQPWQKQFSSGN
jgi:hypothetical protein